MASGPDARHVDKKQGRTHFATNEQRALRRHHSPIHRYRPV
ncbi:hypothetical protein C7S16_3846 [Burkholderia thailandensis]|uniref:Uncharacterized protein n=1 Tax=Burkholderia thailandensis TaxID=57975 RepID=A0AAW9D4B8_BURTH|nr:hypothetical protein [Burkholderia thailandensis]MDW9256734.1 hypothetical protein [Burkholderia thailandensis]